MTAQGVWTAVTNIPTAINIDNKQATGSLSGRLTYTGATTRRFLVNYSGTFIGTSNLDTTTCCGLMLNGSFIGGTKQCWRSVNDTEEYSSSGSRLLQFSTGDYVELGVINETGTDSIVIHHFNLSMVALLNEKDKLVKVLF